MQTETAPCPQPDQFMTNESGFFLDSLVGASKIQQDEADTIKSVICANYPELAAIVLQPGARLIYLTIPFYEKYGLLMLSHLHNGIRHIVHFLYDRESLTILLLNGTSPPIHFVNQKDRLLLNAQTVSQYLQFFCFFVTGEDGPFMIIESLQQPYLLSRFDRADLVDLIPHIEPIRYWLQDGSSAYAAEACVLYGRNFFQAKFLVHPTGMVEMIEDQPLFPETSEQSTGCEDIAENDCPLTIKFIDVSDLKAQEKNAEEHGKKIYQRYLERFSRADGHLPFATVSMEDIKAGFMQIRQQHPHFNEVTDYIEQQLTLSALLNSGVIRLEPIILNGSAGIGKTRYVYDLAAMLNIYVEIINCGSVSNGFEISGASQVWRTGRPGRVVEAVLNAQVINPIVVLDELDKVKQYDQYNVMDSFYALLEPLSAQNFKDEGLNVATNCSHINWLATCNDLQRLPAAIQSRFRCFNISQPSTGQMADVVRSLFLSLTKEHVWGSHFDSQLPDDVLGEMMHLQMPPRLAKQVLMAACSQAAIRYHDNNLLANGQPIKLVPGDIRPVGLPKERSIGFI